MNKATITGKKIRIPIRIQFFDDKNVQVGKTISRTVKSRIIRDVQVGLKNKGVFYGECTIFYDGDNDYLNSFRFTSLKQFTDTLSVDTELDLVREFI